MGHVFGRHTKRNLRGPALQHEGPVHLVFGVQVDGVLKRTRAHVGSAPHQGLQRASAACVVADLQVQAFGFEKSELLRNGQGQVIKRSLAAHCKGYFGFFDFAFSVQGRQGQCGGGQNGAASEGTARDA